MKLPPRSVLAYSTMGFSAVAITILAIIAIFVDSENTMTIFNIVLPVFASWVGTILAFYFGRENFESANQQVRELVQKITPEQRAKEPAMSIMRRLADITCLKITSGKSEADFKLTDLTTLLTGDVSRLPVIDADNKPKYMIHDSRIAKYLASGGNPNDTLEQFIASQKNEKVEYGVNRGFIVIAEQDPLASAKGKLESKPSCQDIFVTKTGNPDEPMTGWISNVRLSKSLEA